MARYTGPVCKLCRREGDKLYLKGARCFTAKCSYDRRPYPPGQHGPAGKFRRGRASDYLLQLREKQKARRFYGLLERQFSNYFKRAAKMSDVTGSNLLRILESRLDNVVYRSGLAASRAQARQLVSHGHIVLNGRRTNVPSALVQDDDVISIRPESTRKIYFKDLRESIDTRSAPGWLSVDDAALSIKIMHLPSRNEIDVPLNEQLIVEYYSR